MTQFAEDNLCSMKHAEGNVKAQAYRVG
uniref:Uncharacterized protein n=1 Tax=Vitis vinifera TaxID=29760 RepID=F6HCN2_VITVI